jgi:hypothetical protein
MNQLGRRVHKDRRDHKHLLVDHLTAVTLPTKKTWGITGDALDQGNTGTCVGHGWRNFLRCAPIRTSTAHPSPFDIYRGAVLLDPWRDNDDEAKLKDGSSDMDSGTTVRAGAKAVANLGRLTKYAWAFSLQPTIEWVLTQGPVVLGTNWYQDMFEPDAKGLVHVSGANAGGHCYLLRGVDTTKALALCTNSWGTTWGRKGNFYLSFKDLEKLILNNGEVCTAVQSK